MVSTETPVSDGEAGASKPFDAFVSYSHADKRYALRIQRFLESARLPRSRGPSRGRLKVFRDDTDIRAARLDAELANALARSRALIVCCSPRAANADWVRQEIELFLKQGGERPIVPVLVEGDAATAIPSGIASYRYVDARGAWKFGWLRPAARGELLRAVAAIAGEDLRTFIPWDRRRRRRRLAAVVLRSPGQPCRMDRTMGLDRVRLHHRAGRSAWGRSRVSQDRSALPCCAGRSFACRHSHCRYVASGFLASAFPAPLHRRSRFRRVACVRNE